MGGSAGAGAGAGGSAGSGAPGSACTDATQCASGECVDLVCCDVPCAGQCEACDVAGSEGTCAAVVGPPHGARAACDVQDGGDACSAAACDGVERASCATFVGAEVSCRTAACQNGIVTLAASCDGQGTCPPAQTFACGQYACDLDACKTSCNGDADCSAGFTCDAANGTCVGGAGTYVCENGDTLVAPDGTKTLCAPYGCDNAAGTCLAICATDADCAPGYVCNGDACVVPPEPGPDGGAGTGTGGAASGAAPAAGDDGCGCSVPGRAGESGFMGVLAGVGIVAARRRGVRRFRPR